MQEYSLSTLPAPSHHFAGLAYGNLASESHAGIISSPKKAALQCLERINYLYSKGFPQIIVPPQKRPNLSFLEEYRAHPQALSIAASSSSMWQANAATISSSKDSSDHKVHFSPANLKSNIHRSLELEETSRILKKLFSDERYFIHHEALDFAVFGGDEGAANHTRISDFHSNPALNLFVYGYSITKPEQGLKPRRQSLESQIELARRHGLNPERIIYARQNPMAIDAGVFHNDVISTGNENLFLYHELAFENTDKIVEEIKEKYIKLKPSRPLELIKVSEEELSLADSVSSYLFNSQILTKANGKMLLLAPEESKIQDSSRLLIERILASNENSIDEVKFINLKESMANGGGPACLRLRILLRSEEFQALNPKYIFTKNLYEALKNLINLYYRDSLSLDEIYTGEFLSCSEEIYNSYYKIFSD